MCLEDSHSVRMAFRLHIGGIVKDEPGKIDSQGPMDPVGLYLRDKHWGSDELPRGAF